MTPPLSHGEDRTELRRAEAELQAAKRSAEAANKAKDQFIAVLSHELRTTLVPAVAALALVKHDARLPSDVREDLEMVSRNIELEVRLIADLLDVSRIISGKLLCRAFSQTLEQQGPAHRGPASAGDA